MTTACTLLYPQQQDRTNARGAANEYWRVNFCIYPHTPTSVRRRRVLHSLHIRATVNDNLVDIVRLHFDDDEAVPEVAQYPGSLCLVLVWLGSLVDGGTIGGMIEGLVRCFSVRVDDEVDDRWGKASYANRENVDPVGAEDPSTPFTEWTEEEDTVLVSIYREFPNIHVEEKTLLFNQGMAAKQMNVGLQKKRDRTPKSVQKRIGMLSEERYAV
jgi:hypothetical protein